MIRELIICDLCSTTIPLRGSVVPDSWLTRDGKHYCGTFCFTVAAGRDE